MLFVLVVIFLLTAETWALKRRLSGGFTLIDEILLAPGADKRNFYPY